MPKNKNTFICPKCGQDTGCAEHQHYSIKERFDGIYCKCGYPIVKQYTQEEQEASLKRQLETGIIEYE